MVYLICFSWQLLYMLYILEFKNCLLIVLMKLSQVDSKCPAQKKKSPDRIKFHVLLMA